MHPLVKKIRLHDTVQCYSLIGTSGPDKTYSTTPTEIKGMFVGKTTVIVSLEGKQIVTTKQLILDKEGYSKIKEGDLVILPPYPNLRFPVVATEAFKDIHGNITCGVCYFK